MKNKYLFGYPVPEIRAAGIRKYLFLILLLGLLRPQSMTAQVQQKSLTLHMQNRPLIEVMEFIEHNTEYRFYYNSKLHDLQRKVSSSSGFQLTFCALLHFHASIQRYIIICVSKFHSLI